MLKLKINHLGILGVAGLILLFGCNSGGSSDSAVSGAAIDTPFVTASCTSSRTIGSSCGTGASTAFFSVYPSDSATRSARTAAECTSLQTAIENGTVLPTALLTSSSEVTCDGTTCTANPTNIWYDSNGHAVATIPTGNYTILVRFSNDAGSTTFKPSDALLCQHATLDSTNVHNVSVESGAGTTIDPVLTATYRTTPSLSFFCEANATISCTKANLENGVTQTAMFQGKTCAQLTTQINTYGTLTTTPDYIHVVGGAKGIDNPTCSSGRGSDSCDFGINSNEDWNDAGGSTVKQIAFGSYAVVTVLNSVGKAHRATRGGAFSLDNSDVIECAEHTFAAPDRGSDIIMTDQGSPNNKVTFTVPGKVSLGVLHAGCTSATCSIDLNGVGAQGMVFPSDVTCASLVSTLNGGGQPNLQPLAVASAEVSCAVPSTKVAPELCSYTTSSWSDQVPSGTYTVVSIMDRFNDLEFTKGPRVGDVVQCKENVAVSATRSSARMVYDYVLTDSDVPAITWKDHITPDLTFTCSSGSVAACGNNLTNHVPFFFTAYNLTCADLLTAATGSSDVNLDAKFVGIGGEFPGAVRTCKTPIAKGEVPLFSCDDVKTAPFNCTLNVVPSRDMEFLKDLQACDDRPYAYFRDGGPITVAAVGDASAPAKAGGPFGDPSILFCKQYSAWNVSTTSLTLDSSTTTTLTSSQAQKLRNFVDNSPVLAR